MKNSFVFVVCGAKEHIDTLHFSLAYLKKYSQNEIFILTDSTRNEIAIKHEHIIDIETPKNYDHHQASIFLKTGIYQFLPRGNQYCYLDTDVVALSPEVDEIFNQYVSPITFAPDHCKVKKFSSYAVNCNCTEEWKKDRDLFETVSNKYDNNNKNLSPELLEKRKELQAIFEALKTNFFQKAWTAFRYFTSINKFHLNKHFYFDKKKRQWIDTTSNKTILYEVDIKKIEEETGFSYNKWTQRWLNKTGNDIWQDECDHLTDYIADDFAINIEEKNWQHWNGGVFLFDDTSHSFLKAWHKKTIAAFDLEKWKTRDQGTLIATVWEFKLQNHSTLAKKWNFIADYNKQGVAFQPENGYFTDDFWKTKHQAAFVHIYHHWADESWSLWQWVKTKL